MTEEHIIVLYSKFSTACTKFMEMVNKLPNFQHTLICIDHPDIRSRLKNSKKLTIREVPSIIRLHQVNGYAETFEGERAFALLNARYIEYLQQTQIPLQQSFQQPIQQQPIHQQPIHQQPIQQQPIQQSFQQYEPQTQPLVSSLAPNKGSSSEEKEKKKTSLSDLMDISELGEVDQEDNGNSNNGIQSFHSVVPQNQIPPTTGILKKDSNSGGNIVSRAMQMQKERESEPSGGPKPPMM